MTYDRAISIKPNHKIAIKNREIVKNLLKKLMKLNSWLLNFNFHILTSLF